MFTRSSSRDLERQVAAITDVNLDRRTATGMARYFNEITIHWRHAVGETDVVPAVGEQWYVVRSGGVWTLDSRAPIQYPALAIPPTQGQVKVGSGNGPVELVGTQINLHGPLRVPGYTTATRPDAAEVGAGGHIYDTTLGLPLWSNGTAWHDATGTVV